MAESVANTIICTLPFTCCAVRLMSLPIGASSTSSVSALFKFILMSTRSAANADAGIADGSENICETASTCELQGTRGGGAGVRAGVAGAAVERHVPPFAAPTQLHPFLLLHFPLFAAAEHVEGAADTRHIPPLQLHPSFLVHSPFLFTSAQPSSVGGDGGEDAAKEGADESGCTQVSAHPTYRSKRVSMVGGGGGGVHTPHIRGQSDCKSGKNAHMFWLLRSQAELSMHGGSTAVSICSSPHTWHVASDESVEHVVVVVVAVADDVVAVVVVTVAVVVVNVGVVNVDVVNVDVVLVAVEVVVAVVAVVVEHAACFTYVSNAAAFFNTATSASAEAPSLHTLLRGF